MRLAVVKLLFSALVAAIKGIKPEQWAKLSDVIVDWLMSIEDKLPAGNPLTVSLNSYRASKSKLTPNGGK